MRIVERDYGKYIQYQNDNGELHNIENFPAVINYLEGNIREYWVNGKIHRTDGPAYEDLNNSQRNKWYYHGKQINCSSQKEFEKLIKLKVFW